MYTIDLNCDMGEGTGNGLSPTDALLLNYISSASIACGYHAGNDDIMRETVNAAIAKGVAIGAHPGLPDKENFGRIELPVSPGEVYEMTLQQINILDNHVKAAGGKLHHVKPHGALYNMAARDAALAKAIVQAVYDIDVALILYALSGSEMIKAADEKGLRSASEVFADRTYTDEGLLTPRAQQGALIIDEAEAIEQVLTMIQQQQVISLNKKAISLKAETVCLHSDGQHAVAFAQLIHKKLQSQNIIIKAAGY